MKVAFCGYDFFSNCFDALCRNPDIEVIKLFTCGELDNERYNFTCKVISTAEKNSIPYKQEAITEEDVYDLFEHKGCDCIVCAAYTYKIPIGKYKGINIHPTLLPIGRGRWPLPKIILEQHKESGVTIHKMTDRLDSGDIILQERFKLLPREDLETLSCRSQMLAEKLVNILFSDFDYYWNNAYEQVGGEYWKFPDEDEMSFSGEMCVEDIDRIVRAYGKFDSLVRFNGKQWLVWDVNCWKEEHDFVPGSIVHQTNKEYLMAAKDGFVCLRFLDVDNEPGSMSQNH